MPYGHLEGCVNKSLNPRSARGQVPSVAPMVLMVLELGRPLRSSLPSMAPECLNTGPGCPSEGQAGVGVGVEGPSPSPHPGPTNSPLIPTPPPQTTTCNNYTSMKMTGQTFVHSQFAFCSLTATFWLTSILYQNVRKIKIIAMSGQVSLSRPSNGWLNCSYIILQPVSDEFIFAQICT